MGQAKHNIKSQIAKLPNGREMLKPLLDPDAHGEVFISVSGTRIHLTMKADEWQMEVMIAELVHSMKNKGMSETAIRRAVRAGLEMKPMDGREREEANEQLLNMIGGTES